jgi:hypothetical protein
MTSIITNELTNPAATARIAAIAIAAAIAAALYFFFPFLGLKKFFFLSFYVYDSMHYFSL